MPARAVAAAIWPFPRDLRGHPSRPTLQTSVLGGPHSSHCSELFLRSVTYKNYMIITFLILLRYTSNQKQKRRHSRNSKIALPVNLQVVLPIGRPIRSPLSISSRNAAGRATARWTAADMIGLDPNLFYDTCLVSWGVISVSELATAQCIKSVRHATNTTRPRSQKMTRLEPPRYTHLRSPLMNQGLTRGHQAASHRAFCRLIPRKPLLQGAPGDAPKN